MSDLIQIKEGISRLAREAMSHEIRRAVIDNIPVYVLADSWNSTESNVLFIHGNKKNKRIYKTYRTKVVLNPVSANKKNGNFADFVTEDIKNKIK